MAEFQTSPELWALAVADLQQRPEQVGFFLAEFDAAARTFVLTDWHAMSLDEVEYLGDYHVTLTEEAQASAIQWAWQAGACLVEAHSHDDRWPASFSPSDFTGFEEWVPHVMWRLRGRPYAALVAAGETFDALAWAVDATQPEDVAAFRLDDGSLIELTHETWRKIRRQEGVSPEREV